MIPRGANVLFAHTMAGGVPRAKILMPTMNKVFKGTGDRHLSSESFWRSDLGRLCEWNFEDVTANTFRDLIELSEPLRARLEREGGAVRYVAYGYHGTETLTRGEFAWQSYAPYLQGWAKMRLEDVAEQQMKAGVKACVFNCPEILTNSSSIFAGVEVPLYRFLDALKLNTNVAPPRSTKIISEIIDKCRALLKPDCSIEDMLKFAEDALASTELRSVCHFEVWPEHSNQLQMEKLIATSENLIAMHKDVKSLSTFVLSEQIFRATGYLMFHESWAPRNPVTWLGHDILAKTLALGKAL